MSRLERGVSAAVSSSGGGGGVTELPSDVLTRPPASVVATASATDFSQGTLGDEDNAGEDCPIESIMADPDLGTIDKLELLKEMMLEWAASEDFDLVVEAIHRGQSIDKKFMASHITVRYGLDWNDPLPLGTYNVNSLFEALDAEGKVLSEVDCARALCALLGDSGIECEQLATLIQVNMGFYQYLAHHPKTIAFGGVAKVTLYLEGDALGLPHDETVNITAQVCKRALEFMHTQPRLVRFEFSMHRFDTARFFRNRRGRRADRSITGRELNKFCKLRGQRLGEGEHFGRFINISAEGALLLNEKWLQLRSAPAVPNGAEKNPQAEAPDFKRPCR